MDEEEDSVPEVDYWEEIRLWMVQPLLRGLLFGVGHFVSFRLLGPLLAKKLALRTG